MAVTRKIYVSAVESELGTAREAVAARLRRLGYIPVWHEYSPSDPADCRPLLARKVRRCKAVIQLVGIAYGPEPTLHQQVGGRTSYAQYEALCAREVDQPVWHFLLEASFPRGAQIAQTAEAEQLQITYRRRVETFATSSQPVASPGQLTSAVDDLRSDLVRIRRLTILRRFGALLQRLGFHRFGLNGHSADETSREQS